MARILFAVCFLVAAVELCTGQQNARKKPVVPEIDQQCLDCICQGSSDCDTSLKCHNAGADAYFCGPFVISWAYWHDGGRPGDKGRAHDFESCLNNKTCAEHAVRGYMKKHGTDCDFDGAISCYDFSRIHKLGPGSCDSNSIDNTDYWQKFLICYEGDGGRAANFDYGGYDYAGGSHLDARNNPSG